MAESAVQTHVRVNHGLLAGLEARVLDWLARRLPAWMSSDQLTLIGLAGMLLAGLSFWLASWERLALIGAVVGLAINWFGDSLDGTVARVRGKLRPRYGYYVDHVVDIIGSVCLVVGMGLGGLMSPFVAGCVLLAYLMLVAEVFLATHTVGVFRLSHWRLGPTELRVLLALGSVRVMVQADVTLAGHNLLVFDLAGVIACVGLVFTFFVAVARNIRELQNQEPPL